MNEPLPAAALGQLFTDAHTHHRWQSRPLEAGMLQRLYELTRWAPTAQNSNPARWTFIVSEEAKSRLIPPLAGGNVDKVKAAPVTVIVAWDPRFYDQLPALFPASPASRDSYAGNTALAEQVAFRNSSLEVP